MSFLLSFSLSLRDGNRTVTSHVGYNKDPQNGLVMPIRLDGAIPQETQPPKAFFVAQQGSRFAFWSMFSSGPWKNKPLGKINLTRGFVNRVHSCKLTKLAGKSTLFRS